MNCAQYKCCWCIIQGREKCCISKHMMRKDSQAPLSGRLILCRVYRFCSFPAVFINPWNTDFTAPLSGAYSFLEEWPNQYLSFIWSRWHQSQTKGPGALEGNSLGGEKKAQQIAVWLRTYSQKLCSSPSPSHSLQSDFLSSVSFACHTA